MTVPSEFLTLISARTQDLINSRTGRSVGPAIFVILLTLVAIHPLLYGSLPRTDDGLQHLYRLVGLDAAIRHWDLWPRYIPTLFYGYGLPLFNFYSPLSLYPLEILHLVGFPFVTTLRLGLIFYLVLGAMGTYLLGRSWGGAVAGIGATVAFIYAPYTLLNMLWRGALAELAGLAVLPWVMLAFKLLAEHGRRRDLALAVIALAVLLLMHNITALFGMIVLVPYCLALWWMGNHPPRVFVHMALAGLIAMGITTFYWLPALSEISFVHIERTQIGVQNPPGTPDFYTQFQTLEQTLSFPEPADLTWFNREVQRTVSWPSLMLGVIGAVLALVQHPPRQEDRQWRVVQAVALVLTILLIATTLSGSAWLWAISGPLRFVQFPWRSLGPASLLVALLAGAGLVGILKRIPSRRLQMVWVAGAVLVIIVYAIPWLYVLYIPDPPAISIVDAQDYERETGSVGGTARGEYIPRWVRVTPDPSRLKGLYLQSDVIPRLQPNPDLAASEMVWEPTAARLKVRAQKDTELVLDWTYFPGWWATLDGERVGIIAREPDGLIKILIPPGEHVVAVGFSPTPLRFGALITSVLFMVGCAVLLARIHWMWASDPESLTDSEISTENLRAPLAVVITVIVVFGIKAIYLDNYPNPLVHARFEKGVQSGLQHPVQATFGGKVSLLGYSLDQSVANPGQTLNLDFFWQPANGMIDKDYSSVIYLRDSAGNIIEESGGLSPGGRITSSWIPGFYVYDPLPITIPVATPPGEYALFAGLYSLTDQQSLEIVDAAGATSGTLIKLQTITVSRSGQPASLDEVIAHGGVQNLDLKISKPLTLKASTFLPLEGASGGPLPVVTYWQANTKPDQVYQHRLVWLNADNQVVASTPPAPLALGYATDLWLSGDLWRGLNMFYIPGKLDAGNYHVAAQLLDAGGQPVGDFGWLGEMAISTPLRSYLPPRSDVTISAYWRVGIWLTGYSLSDRTLRQGDGVKLTLVWQPRSEIARNLTVFVHLLDEKGNIVAQQDSIPASGLRPTTGWAPGEYITDSYALYLDPLKVPPGRYVVRIGWYDPATGERFVLADDTEFWLAPEIIRVVQRS